MRNLKHFITGLLVISGVFQGFSQETAGPQRGEIRDTEFIIRKDRVLSLPTQPRVFEKRPALPQVTTSINYTYQVKNFGATLAPVDLNFQPYQKSFPRPESDQTQALVKFGYGNYSSPLIQADYHSLDNEDYTYGAHFKHQGFYTGPVDGINSAEDHTDLLLNGSFYRDDFEIFGRLGYERDMHHFYGYTPDPETAIMQDSIRQVFGTFKVMAGLRRVDKTEPFDYEANLALRLFNDRYEAKETEVLIRANAGFRANDFLKGGINSLLAFTSPQDIYYEDIKRNYFKLQPYVQYAKESFKIKVGANVVQENDIVPNKTGDFHIFPILKMSYFVVPELGIYGAYEGDVIRNTYYDFIQENPFLGPSENLKNTIQNFQIDAGITGKANDQVNYKIGFKYGDFTNMHFYGNNEMDSTRFQLIYDNNSKVLEYHASLDFNFDDWYQLDASAHYYHYTLDEISFAWQRPEWEVKLNNTFTPDDKWLVHANVNAMGGINAINLVSDNQRILGTLVDLQIGADYAITKRFSAFAYGNNLLNQKYQRFSNYPVRGIQLIGGLSFKF
ncbi:TonB-dependent receptor [uncultured Cyclobacterium sp.]|uniref:TonB-dependent receptor n=1 Tax=uncultured Cyclobacterium sp. TaxID=453820 RepID=UPI0030EE709B